MLTARFDAFDRERRGWSFAFDTPCRVCTATRVEDVGAVVQQADAAASAGQWAIFILTYEAAPAFDAALRVHPARGLPLATVLLFDAPRRTPLDTPRGAFDISPWQPGVSRPQYDHAIHTIHEYIAAGHTYQVNYTFPMTATFCGDDQAWYCALGAAQGAAYSAWIDLGRHHILCLSPELFFERRGTQVLTRPMKGTRPRGRWHEEDAQQIEALRASPKDRAENLMIVDMIRNDVGRVAVPGSVHVPTIFEVERYETVLQMTDRDRHMPADHLHAGTARRAISVRLGDGRAQGAYDGNYQRSRAAAARHLHRRNRCAGAGRRLCVHCADPHDHA